MNSANKTIELESSLTDIFRLTEPQRRALRKLGINSVRDMLYHFPVRHESAGSRAAACGLVPGSKVTLVGTISKLKPKKLWKSRRTATEGYFEDGTGRIKLIWFNQPYIMSYVPQDTLVEVAGTVGGSADKPYISNPEVSVAKDGALSEGLFGGLDSNSMFPIYPESAGISSKWFYHAIKKILETDILSILADPLPSSIRTQYHLPDLASSLIYMHAPEKNAHTAAARKRFAFEEIFLLNVARAQERARNDALASYTINSPVGSLDGFLNSIPFLPTGAQRSAIDAIIHDMQKQYPMARLLEGDVGSGKTLVASATAYAVICNGGSGAALQVAYMAPTEILAQQHFNSFIEHFKDLPINIGLITGSVCKKFPSKIKRGEATSISRSQLLKWAANGEIAMLVGTHALIQKAVQFKHLAYAIVDEQHRFGTKQRAALAKKHEKTPHFLSMTATPIPRTLALTMYGDLDLSVLDELPPGRAKITTKIIKSAEREACYDAIRRELAKGRQAYVICPRIDEPDPAKQNALQAKSAKAEAARLQKDVFPKYVVGLIHGGMKPPEKDSIMRKFTDGSINLLVATSVVEVGVNVPNATAIAIEGAERFGLAQLHQLRGRVMRSSHPPLCFLIPESLGATAMKRLNALEKTDNGFELAEADLQNRGAGDLYGRQQWGVSDLGMEALKNLKLIEAARESAFALVASDPSLISYPALAARIADISSRLQ